MSDNPLIGHGNNYYGNTDPLGPVGETPQEAACICGDMPPGGAWSRGQEPPHGCPVHDRACGECDGSGELPLDIDPREANRGPLPCRACGGTGNRKPADPPTATPEQGRDRDVLLSQLYAAKLLLETGDIEDAKGEVLKAIAQAETLLAAPSPSPLSLADERVCERGHKTSTNCLACQFEDEVERSRLCDEGNGR